MAGKKDFINISTAAILGCCGISLIRALIVSGFPFINDNGVLKIDRGNTSAIRKAANRLREKYGKASIIYADEFCSLAKGFLEEK